MRGIPSKAKRGKILTEYSISQAAMIIRNAGSSQANSVGIYHKAQEYFTTRGNFSKRGKLLAEDSMSQAAMIRRNAGHFKQTAWEYFTKRGKILTEDSMSQAAVIIRNAGSSQANSVGIFHKAWENTY